MSKKNKKQKRPSRPLGQIYLDLEVLFDEMIDEHHVQWGDILNWVFGHLKIHRPDAREEYLDGTHPKYSYGPRKE